MDLGELGAGQHERHPWEQSRVRAVEAILREAGVGQVRGILDVGCGDAYAGRTLLERLDGQRLVGVDVHLTPEQRQAFGGGDSRIELLPDTGTLGDARFDLVLLCDVIEHVADDTELLGVARRYLDPNGRAIVTVPAFQSLFTDHDRMLKHYRRYSLAELESSIERVGLTIERSGYLFASLLPARAMSKLIELVRGSREQSTGLGAWRGGAAVTKALTAVLSFDNAALLALSKRGFSFPGLSAWALCRHPA